MIKIQNLTAGYGKKIILSDINLELENQTYGIIGPNGSGKTTLFRVLTGFRMITNKSILTANLKIYSGNILTSDFSDNKKMIGKKNCQIGYLPQKFGCMPQLTVKEQLQYFCYLKKIPASEEEYEISRVLDAVRMSEFANQKCKKLSGGMVRRVGIAQAILGKPQLILLDEPTTGLDIEERCHFYQIFHQLEGVCPVLVSSHITEDIVEGCTNTIILKNGAILLQEKTEKIKPSLEEVYLKCMRGI